jgi:hypothetical protein
MPLFTDFTHDALGVPRNPAIPANADAARFDLGLCGRPDLAHRTDLCGAFKVPSLRNVAQRRFFFHNARFDSFTVRAVLGSPTAGIASGPFLHEDFRTLEYACTFTLGDDGSLSYEQDTVLQIAGRPEPFHHTDRNTLRKVAGPVPNPRMR